MAVLKLSSPLFFLLTLLLATRAATSTHDYPSLLNSCNQTPHPGLCASMLGDSASNNKPQDDKENAGRSAGLRELAIRATLARVVLAHQLASTMDISSLEGNTKAAWADCLELSEDTIANLNRSLSSACSNEDSQTWLSAAIANQQTCRNRFMELNSTFHFPSSPFLSHNISEAVSNLLAINKAFAPAAALTGRNRKLLTSANRFPTWVSPASQKLLQSPTVSADVVVAKDGSGNYKAISKVVASSVKQRGVSTSRFVIYVKGGAYSENVVINLLMKNLMTVGDGIDKTIVTSSKNVADGSTTFSSATFGEHIRASRGPWMLLNTRSPSRAVPRPESGNVPPPPIGNPPLHPAGIPGFRAGSPASGRDYSPASGRDCSPFFQMY